MCSEEGTRGLIDAGAAFPLGEASVLCSIYNRTAGPAFHGGFTQQSVTTLFIFRLN